MLRCTSFLVLDGSIFRREAPRAAQLEDYVWALNQIHKDFEWPWPTSKLCCELEFTKKEGSNKIY